MNWVMDNRGGVIMTVVAVILGIFLGLILHSLQHGAEAVIGGVGNVSDTNNPHNFSYGSAAGSVRASNPSDPRAQRICVFCHTPHRSLRDASLLNAPLWNHTLSTATYSLRTPGMANRLASNIVKQLATPIQPDGASRLCLSCHDGTVSIGLTAHGTEIQMDTSNTCLDSLGRLTNAVDATCPDLGTDLTNKHVVSVPMNQKLVNAHFANCEAGIQSTSLKYPWDTGNTYTVILRPTAASFGGDLGVDTGTAPSPPYKGGYNYGVQCSTCHDPHLWTTSTDDTKTGYKFLVLPQNTLCEACHVSKTDACQ